MALDPSTRGPPARAIKHQPRYIRHRALGTKWSAPRLMQPREVEDCSFSRAQTPKFPGALGRRRGVPRAAGVFRVSLWDGPLAHEGSKTGQGGPKTPRDRPKTPKMASRRPKRPRRRPKRAPRGLTREPRDARIVEFLWKFHYYFLCPALLSTLGERGTFYWRDAREFTAAGKPPTTPSRPPGVDLSERRGAALLAAQTKACASQANASKVTQTLGAVQRRGEPLGPEGVVPP